MCKMNRSNNFIQTMAAKSGPKHIKYRLDPPIIVPHPSFTLPPTPNYTDSAAIAPEERKNTDQG